MREGPQKWYSIRQYTNEYLDLVYRYYSEAGISYVCTYYNLNIPGSVVDTHTLDGGSYTITGDKSGWLWNRIMLFPIYNTETIQNTFVADERGVGKFDQVSTFNFPSTSGIKPNLRDFVIFEDVKLEDQKSQVYKQQSITDYYKEIKKPVYQVVHFEKATNTDQTFWRTNLKISDQSKIRLDNHLSGDFTYFDNEKHIYTTRETSFLYKLIEKNRSLGANKFYRSNCGFYFI